jgi:nitrite reductase/ring-hydroxylating ferredoxin subunit
MPSDDLWEGEMVGLHLNDWDVLLVNVDGHVRAYEGRCPHQGTLLSEGDLCDGVLTCQSHVWEFDAVTGEGINPRDASLKVLPVKVEDGIVFVDLCVPEQA